MVERTIQGGRVRIYPTKAVMGAAAAEYAAGLLREVLTSKGSARIVISTGNSMFDFIDSLTQQPGIQWANVTALHLDEYVGIPAGHSASFRRWIKERVEDRVHPGTMHYVQGDADDIQAECQRYGQLLDEAPIDIGFIGFGENAHIAFNDPPVADFNDPQTVKTVELDLACRQQQVGEGHYPDLAACPTHAVTVTCSAIMRFRQIVAVVPEARKAQAVRCALEGPISTACPASIVRTHPDALLFLDSESASLLQA